MLNMKEIMNVATKSACSIQATSLQRQWFIVDLQKAECDHSELLLRTKVKWLCQGKIPTEISRALSGDKVISLSCQT